MLEKNIKVRPILEIKHASRLNKKRKLQQKTLALEGPVMTLVHMIVAQRKVKEVISIGAVQPHQLIIEGLAKKILQRYESINKLK
jgi:hypothetical protein